MGNNKLKLNPDKTEFIVIGDDQIRSSLKSSFPVSLLGNTMEPAESVKNLGVILDAENSIQRHVVNICRISYYHLRELRRVRRYLNHETAVKVANALVSSRLDYCNSLLYNTKKAYTSRLQRVQNALCRTLCKLNKFANLISKLKFYKLIPYPMDNSLSGRRGPPNVRKRRPVSPPARPAQWCALARWRVVLPSCLDRVTS